MLHLQNVSYERGRATIVDAVDLEIEPGTVTVLLGPADAGTATLLGLIGGALLPTRGRIACDEPNGVARLAIADGAIACRGGAGFHAPYVVLEDDAATRTPSSPGAAREGACRLLRACARFAARGAGVVAALRDVDLAAAFADRVVLMHRGLVVADGVPEIVLDPAFVRSVFKPRWAMP